MSAGNASRARASAEAWRWNVRMSVRALSGGRGGQMAFADVDLELAPASAIVLRGENGAGKTTLLRVAAGLLDPLSGSCIFVDGAGAEWPAGDAACFIGHENGVKSALTARENIQFWSRLYGTGRDDIDAALDRLALGGLSERFAGGLSAGQRRRLGVARAIVSGRPIWLMDEPTASLDDASSSRVAKAITDHCAVGGAALIATHEPIDLPNAESVALQATAAQSGRAD